MLQLLTCSKGHSWEAAADDGAAVGRAVCPVCGDSVELLPLFDLAPSADAITAAPEPILPQAPPLRDAAGQPVVAGFEIQEDLGRTPLGVRLYKAKQLLVGRTVLLKVVVARDDAGQTGWGALRGEAAALGRISHPNVVQILEAGERERQLFYNAVEWVDGPTLAEHAAGRPLPPQQAARLVEVLARALHAAHQQGQVHRGLRPACVRLQPAPEGEKKQRTGGPVEPPFWSAGGASRVLPRVGDFGLARRPVEGDAADVELYDDMPSYLSPEQAWGRSREIGPPSDIYALGAILYELLTGRPPFRGRTPGETLDHIRSGDPPSLYRHVQGLPVDLAAVCRKAMQRNPRNRYRTALEFADDLRAFVSGRPVKARTVGTGGRLWMWLRRRPLAAALLVACLLAAVGMLTAYLVGAAEAAGAREEVGKANLRASTAEGLQSDLQKQVTDAVKREQRSAYYHRILLADREWRAGNLGRARQLLALGPPDAENWEWHYLDYRLNNGAAPEYLSLTGPTQAITCIAYSPDGRWLAAASGPEPRNFGDRPKPEVRVWELAAPDAKHVLTGFGGVVRRVAFSPDGKRLATVSFGSNKLTNRTVGELKEWDPVQGQVLSSRSLDDSLASDVAYSPDGKRLLVADEQGRPHVFPAGAPGGELPMNFPGWFGAPGPRRLAVLNPDGTRVALVAPDGVSVQIYDGQRDWTGGAVTLRHTDGITALAFSPETNLLASASKDGTAKVWDVRTSRPGVTLQGHTGAVMGLSFTGDGRRLATAGADGDVRIWDPATGQEVYELTPFEKGAGGDNGVTAVQFSPAAGDWRLPAAHGNEVRVFGPPRP